MQPLRYGGQNLCLISELQIAMFYSNSEKVPELYDLKKLHTGISSKGSEILGLMFIMRQLKIKITEHTLP